MFDAIGPNDVTAYLSMMALRLFDAFMKHAKDADIGLYVTLHKPTKGMIADAKMAGSYHSIGWQQDWQPYNAESVKACKSRLVSK